MIRFICPKCQESYEVSEEMAGKKARCSKCWQPLLVATPPAASTVHGEGHLAEEKGRIAFACDGCFTSYSVPEDRAGKRTTCPKCKKSLTVPTPQRNGSTPIPVRVEPAPLAAVGLVASQVQPVLSETLAAPPANQESNLRPCPDCQREVSRRAAQCPHCGCPLATAVADKASTFEAVFSAFVQAVREAGHLVQALDKQNGQIAFKSARKWYSWEMDFSCVIIDNGDGTCSGDAQWAFPGLTDWGKGRRVVKEVVELAVRILASRGMPNCFRLK
jgi:hypothetical protein